MDNQLQPQKDAMSSRPKPAVPKKPVFCAGALRSTHVRDVVQKLEDKGEGEERERKEWKKRSGDEEKNENVAEPEASRQTLEDLKAIDEDLEKLRKQIEERDKIIEALREAAEAKDKKLETLAAEFSKLQSGKKLGVDTCPESMRTNSLSPISPPLCKGGLCWTDNFVIKNYHEPIYAQLLNDHTNLRKIYNNLCNQLEIKSDNLKEFKMKDANEIIKKENEESAINLIMMEQIRMLKEREAQLMWEAEELREQNDLMEFRILELEECRKEFLDREAEDEKRQKNETKWSERDLEEVSDSGVVSLPTSEDLTSDSELGEAIRNYSPLGGFNCLPTDTVTGKKSECLQESGIFVESEVSSECGAQLIVAGSQTSKRSRGSQTEIVLDKALLDIIDSSCGLLLGKNSEFLKKKYVKPDDLSTELSKLSVIQERIRQKTNTPTSKNQHTIFTCPHSSSLLFYEDRLQQLESKIKIYESSGDTKDILLAKRLEKEVELAFRVKELSQKVENLEFINKKLEEEKCEFEEAENDTRFQCQRLNTRLQELLDKNTELELELERQKIIMTEEKRRQKKKESLHGLISQYEQRNFELEEKEVETKQRLSMIEAAMPAIVAWNVFRTIQNPDFVHSVSGNVNAQCEQPNQTAQINPVNSEMFQRIEELMDGQRQLKKECEKVEETASDREKTLRNKIEELETKAAKDRELLEEMTKSLKSLKQIESCSNANPLRPEDIDLFEELKQMIASEIQLRAEIDRLEKKEQAYMQSLEKADEIWAGMEADYKRRLAEAEAVNENLQKRIIHLEATQSKLEKALENHSLPKMETLQIKSELQSKIEELMCENEKLKVEISKSLNEKFDEHKRFLEVENSLLKKEVQKMKDAMVKEEERYLLVQKKLELAEEEAKRERETGNKLRDEIEDKTLNLSASETKLQAQISELTQELSAKSKELMGLEVTVSELREEVETLERRVAELMKAMRSSTVTQEEEGQTQITEVSLPNEKPTRHVVSFSFSKVQQKAKEEKELQTISHHSFPQGKQVRRKQDKLSLNLEILQPLRSKLQSVLSPVLFSFQQEIKFLFSPQNSARMYLIKNALPLFESINVLFADQISKEIKKNVTKDEILRITLENTELQQTLKRMEEESRLKSEELKELQKTALEIRKEQKMLESMYELRNLKRKVKTEEKEVQNNFITEFPVFEDFSKKVRKTRSKQSLNTLGSEIEKTTEPFSASLFNFHQVVDDETHHRCRTKSLNVNLQAKEPEPMKIGDNLNPHEGVGWSHIKNVDANLQAKKDDEIFQSREMETVRSMLKSKSVADNFQRRLSTPKGVEKTSSATCSMLFPSNLPVQPNCFKPSVRDNLAVDPQLSFAPSIKSMKKVGDDGILLEWDIARKPPNVAGFEINVNGSLAHRVRSSTRNKALLHPLNLSEKISIQLFAVSESGRSPQSSQAVFQNEGFRLQTRTGCST